MWCKLRVAVLLVAFMTSPFVPAQAHHSLDAEFHRGQHMKVTGLVTKIEWMNPHAWLIVDVKESDTGKVTKWALQLPSPNMLNRLGWARDPFKLGITVTVDGYPAKDGSRRGCAQEVVSSEGKRLFVSGTSGTL